LYCPECGTENITPGQFCENCGAGLASTTQSAAPAPPAGKTFFSKLSPAAIALIAGVACVFSAAIAYGAVSFVNGSSGDTEELAEQTADSEIKAAHTKEAGCQSLSQAELDRLRQLQTEIPYTIFVPDCLPAGFKLDPGSIGKRVPVSTGNDADGQPSNMKLPEYYFDISKGAVLLTFGGHSPGDPGAAKQNYKEVRGHQAIVYSGTNIDASGRMSTVPFEDSSFYRVLWFQDRDFTKSESRYDANYVQGKNIGWTDLLKIINNLEPVADIDTNATDDSSTTQPAGSDIRAENWTAVVGAGPLPADDHIESVFYSDFTGDGNEDALVLDRLSGSGGFLRLFVYSFMDGNLTRLFEALDVPRGKARLGQTADSFVMEYSIADGDEPNCCPRHLGIKTYTWSKVKSEFTVTSEEVVPNPAARD
jgi:hypothetical protein